MFRTEGWAAVGEPLTCFHKVTLDYDSHGVRCEPGRERGTDRVRALRHHDLPDAAARHAFRGHVTTRDPLNGVTCGEPARIVFDTCRPAQVTIGLGRRRPGRRSRRRGSRVDRERHPRARTAHRRAGLEPPGRFRQEGHVQDHGGGPPGSRDQGGGAGHDRVEDAEPLGPARGPHVREGRRPLRRPSRPAASDLEVPRPPPRPGGHAHLLVDRPQPRGPDGRGLDLQLRLAAPPRELRLSRGRPPTAAARSSTRPTAATHLHAAEGLPHAVRPERATCPTTSSTRPATATTSASRRTPTQPQGARRLDYIEEPHGDRIVLTYDDRGRVKKVAEVHPGSGEVRALGDRVRPEGRPRPHRERVGAGPAACAVDYTLRRRVRATSAAVERSGQNLAGAERAAPVAWRLRVHRQRSRRPPQAPRGASTPTRATGSDYVYYAARDPFLGEDSGLLVQRKEEYVKEVEEHRGAGGIAQHPVRVRLPPGAGRPEVQDDGHGRRAATPRATSSTATAPAGDPGAPGQDDGHEVGDRRHLQDAGEGRAGAAITEFGYDERGNLTSERIHTADLGVVETLYQYEPAFNKLTFKKDAEGRETDLRDRPRRRRPAVHPGRRRQRHCATSTTTTASSRRRHGPAPARHRPRAITTASARRAPSRDPLGNVTTREYDAARPAHPAGGHLGPRDAPHLRRPGPAERVTGVAGGDSYDDVTDDRLLPRRPGRERP